MVKLQKMCSASDGMTASLIRYKQHPPNTGISVIQKSTFQYRSYIPYILYINVLYMCVRIFKAQQ